jgi:DNA-binding NarL/FixJ family response regulator
VKVRTDLTRACILLADDHQEMRARAVCLLEAEFEIVGAVADGNALLRAESETHPDVCVIDIAMPVMCGLDAAAKLTARGSKSKIVLLTVYEDLDFLTAAIASGALGYVVKARMASDLPKAIHEALAGRLFVSPSVKLRTNSEH